MARLIGVLMLVLAGCTQVTEHCDTERRLSFEYYGFTMYCRLVGVNHELGDLWACVTQQLDPPEWFTDFNPVDNPEVFIEHRACVDSPLIEYREYGHGQAN